MGAAAPGAPGAAAPGAPGAAVAPGSAPSAPGTAAAAGAGATSSFSGMLTTAMVAFLITLVLKRTPSGGLMSEMWIDSAILRFETSTSIFSGICAGLHTTGRVRETCWRMPPSVTPTGLPVSTTGTLTTTSWSMRTSRKSAWRTWPSTGSFSKDLKSTVRVSPPSTCSVITVLNLCGVAMALVSASGSTATRSGSLSNGP